MEEITAKLNKFNMDNLTKINKVENTIKEVKSEIKKQLDTFK